MVTTLAELAIVVSLITLSQRLIGYENKPLGYFLLLLAVMASIYWLREFISKRFSAHSSNRRTIATVLAGVFLFALVAYPWVTRSRSTATVETHPAPGADAPQPKDNQNAEIKTGAPHKDDPAAESSKGNTKTEAKNGVDALKKGIPSVPKGTMSGIATGPITVQPGAALSIGQQGGQTIGTLITQEAMPKVTITEIEGNRLDGNIYLTRLKIAVTGAIAPSLAIRVSAPSLSSMELVVQTGLLMQSVSELKDGTKTHTIANAMGEYQLALKSTKSEYFKVEYGCSPLQCK